MEDSTLQACTNSDVSTEADTLSAGTNADIVTGADLTTINDTIDRIEEIYHESVATIHESIGKLIIEKIFKDDLNSAIDINKADPVQPKAKLFKQFVAELLNKSKDNRILPKKTFLYNCVNLILDNQLLENSPEFEKYKALSISHRIELLSVKGVDAKAALITDIKANNLSVRQLREQIVQESNDNDYTLLAYIQDPSRIDKVDDIKLVGGKKNEVAIEKATSKIAAIEEQITNSKENIKKLNALVKKLNDYTPAKGRKKKKAE